MNPSVFPRLFGCCVLAAVGCVSSVMRATARLCSQFSLSFAPRLHGDDDDGAAADDSTSLKQQQHIYEQISTLCEQIFECDALISSTLFYIIIIIIIIEMLQSSAGQMLMASSTKYIVHMSHNVARSFLLFFCHPHINGVNAFYYHNKHTLGMVYSLTIYRKSFLVFGHFFEESQL